MLDTNQPRHREVVGTEYGGRWIVWSDDGMRIVASGETFQEALNAAPPNEAADPILEFVPDSDAGFVGGL